MFRRSVIGWGSSRCVVEVSDSITWRRFCRIGLEQPVPHPTTLMKLTTRCGSAAVEGLNEALLAKAADAKLLRCARVRVDTTVVPSNVGLSHRRGSAGEGGWSDRSDRSADSCGGRRHQDAAAGPVLAAGKRAHAIASKLRSRAAAGREEAMAAVTKANAELADLADTARGGRSAAGQRETGAAESQNHCGATEGRRPAGPGRGSASGSPGPCRQRS